MHAVEALEMLGGVADHAAVASLSSRRSLAKELSAGTIVRTTYGRYALPSCDDAVKIARAVAARERTLVDCLRRVPVGLAASRSGAWRTLPRTRRPILSNRWSASQACGKNSFGVHLDGPNTP